MNHNFPNGLYCVTSEHRQFRVEAYDPKTNTVLGSWVMPRKAGQPNQWLAASQLSLRIRCH